MNNSWLIFRNLWYHRKAWLSVTAGAVISIAVLTGALAVGDSVRYSLQNLTDKRLGKTRYILQSGDYLFRDSLAAELSEKLKEDVAPVLLAAGIAVNSEKDKRINRVEVIGIDSHFPEFWDDPGFSLDEDEAIISQNLASKLQLQTGDDILLRIRKQLNISPNAPFAADKERTSSLRLTVKAIAGDDKMGRFSLKSNQAAPFNVFISLHQLNKAIEAEGKANVLLLKGGNLETGKSIDPDSLLAGTWNPNDIGLKIKRLREQGQFEIVSERIFMNDKIAEAVRSSVPGSAGIMTYLANSLGSGKNSVPYSFVSAADSVFINPPITGPEIIINEWLANDLQTGKGDSLIMSYFVVGPYQSLKEEKAGFIIKDVIQMKDPRCDSLLMPDFPGMSDAGNCRDWETTAPIDVNRIRNEDEIYWKDFRGTPKAFISLQTGQRLWNNAFGGFTAFRFTANDLEVKKVERSIMEKLKPSEQGFSLLPVYDEGQKAVAESIDFGGLFLGLSFFIIFSGFLLMGIIFSIHAYSRLTETAVLSSIGFRKSHIMKILFTEALIIAAFAGIAGSLLGIGYDRLMLLGLNTLWQDSVRTSSLQMHVRFSTVAIGSVAGMITALLVLLIILLRKMRDPLIFILHGKNKGLTYHFRFFSRKVSARDKSGKTGIPGNFPSFLQLIMKNLRLNPGRNIAASLLLAIGTFAIIITGANRRIFPDAPSDRNSGTGGFLFWAESTIPVIYDLNTISGKREFAFENDSLFRNVFFLQMYRLEGNDASCLNLNRVSTPPLLGINTSYFDSISAFSFHTIHTSLSRSHPWNELRHPLADGVIPGFADQTVIQWGLGKSVGDTLHYSDESGKPLKILLTAGLENSVFQGYILISDTLFRKHFPSIGGSGLMLVDGPYNKRDEIGSGLEEIFRDYGMIVTSAPQRLDEFNSVQNTYLSVFILLGGLGVVIGSLGLGFLIIRNLQERRHEMANYFVLGFRKRYILNLVIAEHVLILVSGTVLGILAGLASILPSLSSPTADIPFGFLSITIAVIFLNGFLWVIIPVLSAFRSNPVQELRKE